jgi:hypothetical protein
MKHLTESIALFLSGITLAGVLTCLAANSEGKDFCRSFTVETRTACDQGCMSDSCTLRASNDQSTPTLAPPQPELSASNGPESNDVANGQSVFLTIETDQSNMEIEYSWANP